MIFSNDRSIYMESNGKKLDEGIKKSESEWKMENGHLSRVNIRVD